MRKSRETTVILFTSTEDTFSCKLQWIALLEITCAWYNIQLGFVLFNGLFM